MAELELEENGQQLLVASVHLAPFEDGQNQRKLQMEALLDIAATKSLPILIAGDTNMRSKEDETMEQDLHLLDIWKLSGSKTETEWTWDTIDHRTATGGSFNKYYGANTRQYRQRYDRMYFKTPTNN